MKAPIRVGLIGFGVAGRVFHAPLLAALDRYELRVVVTRSEDRRRALAASHPDAVAVDTVDELLAAAVDLVVVAGPPSTHLEHARAAIDAGLAVVVDKPFTVTADEGRLLAAEAARRGVVLTVFQNRRFDGDFLTLGQLLSSGSLGVPHRFESRFEWWKPEPERSWKSEATVEQGGGILHDLGTHLLDQALLLFGGVDDARAEIATRRPGASSDDDVFVALQHSSGVVSHLWMSALAAQPGPRFRLLGSAGAYVKTGLDPQEALLASGLSPLAPEFRSKNVDRPGLIGAGDDLRETATRSGDSLRFYRELAATLTDGAPVPVDPADAIRVLELIEELRS